VVESEGAPASGGHGVRWGGLSSGAPRRRRRSRVGWRGREISAPRGGIERSRRTRKGAAARLGGGVGGGGELEILRPAPRRGRGKARRSKGAPAARDRERVAAGWGWIEGQGA
jgi:hypothetical protein